MKDDASSQQQKQQQEQQPQQQQQQVISINLMAFHLQPKLNRLFALLTSHSASPNASASIAAGLELAPLLPRRPLSHHLCGQHIKITMLWQPLSLPLLLPLLVLLLLLSLLPSIVEAMGRPAPCPKAVNRSSSGSSCSL
ncbi:hypothetical protein AWZ03_009326 [Drosophila navojoa]|uniref:Uncharacterized protein n=1 Tax=Drosophila navojoa TaxID=7232 RepID=A0A484B8S5_DRONA|nr:hypothetical protein AWZ03_009326 [Drosophila navojoa]